jgi:hypothetical protein
MPEDGIGAPPAGVDCEIVKGEIAPVGVAQEPLFDLFAIDGDE